jgi:hypothetical protein
MKVAVLYSGQIRTWNQCRANQESNLFTPETDLFFHTYTEPESTNYKQFIKIPDDYFDANIVNQMYPNRNPVSTPFCVLQPWLNSFIGWCICPKEYDIYVRSRCDIQLSGKINFEDYVINDSEIYIPLGNDYCGGINDQFAFGNYHVMKTYFSIFTEFQNIYRDGVVFHPESYVTENLKRHGIHINRLSVTNTILR